MYWVNKQKYDLIAEFHLDARGASASGGHVIISSALMRIVLIKVYKM